MLGETDHSSAWLGFHGADMVATVDLGAAVPLRSVGIRCLQTRPLGIFLPTAVEFEASDDGAAYRPLAAVAPTIPTTVEQAIELVRADVEATARYLRVRGRTIPAGHKAAGQPAWLFVDEILVNPEPTAAKP